MTEYEVVTYGTYFHTPMCTHTSINFVPDAYMQSFFGFRALRYRAINGVIVFNVLKNFFSIFFFEF